MEFKRGLELGRGRFGSVYRARIRGFSCSVAVKTAKVSKHHSIIKEKVVLNQLNNCPFVIKCFGDNYSVEKGVQYYNLFLEYASGGCLMDRIRNSALPPLSEYEIRLHTKCILSALSCVHLKQIVHCDVKPQNILLVSRQQQQQQQPQPVAAADVVSSKRRSPLVVQETAKLADFGLARPAGRRRKPGGKLGGTPMYVAPECVRGECEAKSDIWSLGCTVLEMFTGNSPWSCDKNNVEALLKRIGETDEVPEIPSFFSREAQDFLRKCLVKDPEFRWSADELLEHPFVSYLGEDRDYSAEVSDARPVPSPAEALVESIFAPKSDAFAADDGDEVDLLIKPYKIMGKYAFGRLEEQSSKRRKVAIEVAVASMDNFEEAAAVPEIADSIPLELIC